MSEHSPERSAAATGPTVRVDLERAVGGACSRRGRARRSRGGGFSGRSGLDGGRRRRCGRGPAAAPGLRRSRVSFWVAPGVDCAHGLDEPVRVVGVL